MSNTRLQGEEGHVAVLAFPFATHPAALLAVIRCLASFTPNTVYSFFSTAKSNASYFTSQSHQHSHANMKAYDVEDGMREDYILTGKPMEDIELFLQAASLNFNKGMKVAVATTGRKVSCLVTDAFLWFAADMAKEMQVPWLAVWTSGLTSLSSHIHTDLIRDTLGNPGGLLGRENENLMFIPGMTGINVSDLPEGIVFGNLTSVFSCMLYQMGKALPEAAAVFANSFEELEPAITYDLKSKLKQCLPIGPFNLLAKPSRAPAPDETRCLNWLDKEKLSSVAYISFGSVAIPPQNELVALAEGLETSRVPFLWSLKEHVHSQLPQGFLERTRKQGLVVPWTPQVDVLSHSAVAVFITHGGWNSVLESIAGGVPMICRPFFGDHRINSRMISDVWKVGVSVEGGIFTKDGVASILKDLIQSPKTWTEMRENVVAFKQLAETAAGPGGSSTQNLKLLMDVLFI